MKDFFVDLAVEAAVSLPVFCLVMFVLWKLRKRAWTALLGFVFQVLFLCAYFAIAEAMHTQANGSSPIDRGIAMGCDIPIMYLFIYHITQKRDNTKRER